MAKRVFPTNYSASRVKTKGRVDRGKQLEYEIFQNFDRTRSLENDDRVIRRGAIETVPDRKKNFLVDEKGKVVLLNAPPTKVLTTEAAQRERALQNAPKDFWVGCSSIKFYTTWTYRVVEKRGEPGELRLHFSRGRFIYVRVYESIRTIQFSTATDKQTALARHDSGSIFWAGTKKFKS